jgi:type I restriction enzyme R subunit
VYGDEQPLALFIRSIVGLDRSAAKHALANFLDENRYNSRQIRFAEMIIERLTQLGVMDPGLLYEPPFTSVHHEGLDGLFPEAAADQLVQVIENINRNAQAA